MNIGVIFAGGVGSRMQCKDKPKQFLEIYGKPIIVYTIEHFQSNSNIDSVVVVCVEGWLDYCKDLMTKFNLSKVVKVVPGGASGQLSIYNGLKAAREVAGDDNAIVLIHDGVRPMISSELLSQNIEDVKKYGSSITSAIVKETVVIVDEGGKIGHIPDRAHSRMAKAPQCFYLNDILKVHEDAVSKNKTDYIDSCTMMNAYGFDMHMTDGPYENIKITTPDDFYMMRAMLQAKDDAKMYY